MTWNSRTGIRRPRSSEIARWRPWAAEPPARRLPPVHVDVTEDVPVQQPFRLVERGDESIVIAHLIDQVLALGQFGQAVACFRLQREGLLADTCMPRSRASATISAW